MEIVSFNFPVKRNSSAVAHMIDVGHLQKKLTFGYNLQEFLGMEIGDLCNACQFFGS